VLSTTSDQFRPLHRRKPGGEVDARPWRRGFHAAMQPRMFAWDHGEKQQELPELYSIDLALCPCSNLRTFRKD